MLLFDSAQAFRAIQPAAAFGRDTGCHAEPGCWQEQEGLCLGVCKERV